MEKDYEKYDAKKGGKVTKGNNDAKESNKNMEEDYEKNDAKK